MKKLLIAILFMLPALVYSQTRVDSTIVVNNDGDTIRYATTYRVGTYADGDSLQGRSTSTKKRVLVSPLDLPVSTLMQTALNLKATIATTDSMRTNIYNAINGKASVAANALKLNISDTSAMLDAYKTSINLRATVAANSLKLNISDTSAMLTAYQNAINTKQATLVSNTNIKTVNGTSLLGSGDITQTSVSGNAGTATALQNARTINGVSFNGTANITVTNTVASANIAATASATSTTTLYTPSASGMYRLSVYLKITTTGTSPVAGPVTITYTEPDGSVAQSHVMLLQSVTGTVVTTTVNNSTTTGTVNGSMVFSAKTGVAIQYAIAVSGTFGAGRYTAHFVLEAL